VSAHSKLGASSYYRWKACPGSIRQCEGLESKSSAYAEKGTLAHDVAARILEGKPYSLDGLDEEDVEAIRTYTDFVGRCTQPNVGILIEQRFDLSRFVAGAFGTADCVLYHSVLEKLVVIDYKHGAGIPVDVVENSQLMYYGLGALIELEKQHKRARSIELIVVQPRCFHPDGPIRRWVTTPGRVLEFVADLVEDAKATQDPNAPLVPGDHCRFCPAQAMNCPAVREKSLALAKLEFRTELTYDEYKLAEVLRNLPLLQDWINGVREFAYREAEHGRIPPGFKMVAKRATRKWREPFTPDRLAKEFGLRPPDCMEVKTISPAQLEKKMDRKSKVLVERLEEMVVAESSGNTLVEETDPRPAISAAARDVFGVIT
jgi:hypothetical protein